MSGGRKAVLAAAIVALAGIIAGVIITSRAPQEESTIFTGAVMKQDNDPRRQAPIANAEITATSNTAAGKCMSDPSGFFQLTLRPALKTGQEAVLRFQHSDYQPLEITARTADQIFVARMTPISPELRPEVHGPQRTVGNIRLRYSVKTTTTVNVGSIAKTFEAANKGGIRCNGHDPCSPDGRWKATIGSASFDAGEGNEFRDPRVSCIAGPCPFTSNEFTVKDGTLKVTTRNWSDTTTFLVEAEAIRTHVSDMIRYSFPVTFDSGMNFTLPATAEGASIEADLDGTDIVFPLGPKANLSWAACTVKIGANQSKMFRCELKPGFRFK